MRATIESLTMGFALFLSILDAKTQNKVNQKIVKKHLKHERER
jgi:hypothetical protein